MGRKKADALMRDMIRAYEGNAPVLSSDINLRKTLGQIISKKYERKLNSKKSKKSNNNFRGLIVKYIDERPIWSDLLNKCKIDYLLTLNSPDPYGPEKKIYDRHHNCAKLYHRTALLLKRILSCGGKYKNWKSDNSMCFGFMEHYNKLSNVTFPHMHIALSLNPQQVEWLNENIGSIKMEWLETWNMIGDNKLFNIEPLRGTKEDVSWVSSYITKQAHLTGTFDVILGDERFVEKYIGNQALLFGVSVTTESMCSYKWVITKENLAKAIRYRDEHYGKVCEVSKRLAAAQFPKLKTSSRFKCLS